MRKGFENMDCAASSVLRPERTKKVCCLRNMTNSYDVWISISPHHGKFIFYTTYPEDIHLLCNGSRFETSFKMGIVYLDPGCTLQTRENYYHAVSFQFDVKHQQFFRALTDLVIAHEYKNIEKKYHATYNLSKINLQKGDIEDLFEDLNWLQTGIQALKGIHWSWWISVLLLCLILVLYIIKKYRNRGNERPQQQQQAMRWPSFRNNN